MPIHLTVQPVDLIDEKKVALLQIVEDGRMEKRVISTDVMEEDHKIENSLRPKLLCDYIGQKKARFPKVHLIL